MGLPEIPHDDWFPPTYKNPLDSMPVATYKGEPNRDDGPEWSTEEIVESWIDAAEKGYDDVVEEGIHEKMYRLATESGKHTIGGSENIQ
tara:strand:- start:953 stop:1219 length:267 start_codon:yes stop_codon:yes gene_type:complete